MLEHWRSKSLLLYGFFGEMYPIPHNLLLFDLCKGPQIAPKNSLFANLKCKNFHLRELHLIECLLLDIWILEKNLSSGTFKIIFAG